MANSIDFNGIVKSKYTLYYVILSAANLFGYISKKYNSILIFIFLDLLKNIYKNTNIINFCTSHKYFLYNVLL